MLIVILIATIGLKLGFQQNKDATETTQDYKKPTEDEFDDSRKLKRGSAFNEIELISELDGEKQKAYFLKSEIEKPMPLVVSLHSWSGYYNQFNPLANLASKNNFNFISPDFRGANNHPKACCSDYVIQDIDQAITYALTNSNVDTSKIWVIGGSGGGYATLCLLMKTRHNVDKYIAWNPITDIEAWYNENEIKQNKYVGDILNCTNSVSEKLNLSQAKLRSPIYMDYPKKKIKDTEIHLFAGGYDGLLGQVSPTHSINFFNSLLSNFYPDDSLNIVSVDERLHLLEKRSKLGEFGQIGDREVFLKKSSHNISLTIFEGKHEVLWDYAFEFMSDPS